MPLPCFTQRHAGNKMPGVDLSCPGIVILHVFLYSQEPGIVVSSIKKISPCFTFQFSHFSKMVISCCYDKIMLQGYSSNPYIIFWNGFPLLKQVVFYQAVLACSI